MSLLREIRRRARQVAPQVIAVCLVGYFAYHALQGERGLFAFLRLEQELAEAEQVHAELAAERQALEHKVGLLRPEHLDPDMLEEQARRLLDYARDDEVVILLEPGDEGAAAGPSMGRP